MNSISKAARALGRIRTEKKAAASRENGKLGGGQTKRLADIPCSCGEGVTEHKSTCRRGIAIRYRTKKGLPLT
jgi:hypothetical protein